MGVCACVENIDTSIPFCIFRIEISSDGSLLWKDKFQVFPQQCVLVTIIIGARVYWAKVVPPVI